MVGIYIEDNVIHLLGPLDEIKKWIVVCEGDDGEVLNIALDDAILMNRTIYQINKPLLNERDKLKLQVAKLGAEVEELEELNFKGRCMDKEENNPLPRIYHSSHFPYPCPICNP